MISVRQTRALPKAFFRFHLTMDTLALGYTLPTTRACYGLSPIRLRPYWAHQKSSPLTFAPKGCFSLFLYFTVTVIFAALPFPLYVLTVMVALPFFFAVTLPFLSTLTDFLPFLSIVYLNVAHPYVLDVSFGLMVNVFCQEHN